jgi:hypothetical protein
MRSVPPNEEDNARIAQFARQVSEIAQERARLDLCGLCLPHVRKLLKLIPEEVRLSILLATQKQSAELTQKLTTLPRN